MKRGDLIQYDRYGGLWETVSPSLDPVDWGFGLFLSDEDDVDAVRWATFLDERGMIRKFAICYLASID